MALVAATLVAPAVARADGQPVAQHRIAHLGVTLSHHHRHGAGTASPTGAATGWTPDFPGQVKYHGGPVMKTNQVYAMYWFPAGYTLDTGWQGAIDTWFGHVAADSGATSNVFGDTAQYGVGYSASFLGSAQDTTPFPASQCTAAPVCLTESQIFHELRVFAQSQGWGADPGSPASKPTHLFVVYLPKNVADCFDPDPGQTQSPYCSATDGSTIRYYCAYHTAWTSGGETYVWANLPYTWDQAGCQSGQFPSGSAVTDTAIDVTSHEYIEALTDPYLTAWWDDNGNEVADKCQTEYGSFLGGSPGTYWNQDVNGAHYSLQLEYSNRARQCYQVGPTITSVSPGTAGSSVDIAGSSFVQGATPFTPVTVTFNGIASPSVTIDSDHELHAEVPPGNTVGRVTVSALGGTGTSTSIFGPTPAVTSLSAASGYAGTTVTVTGTGFFRVKSVKFGGVAGSFSSVTADGTSLKAKVPLAALDGFVTVTTAAGASANTEQFVVLPRITSFAPQSATGLSTVTIHGSGLGGVSEVDFNGVPSPSVDFARSTATAVYAQVPVDTTAGHVVVKVSAGTLSSSPSTASFTPRPKVTSLDTYDGLSGDPVKIFGSNLTSGTDPVVKFGGRTAVVISTSATEVHVTVPGAPFSRGKVTLATASGTATSPEAFAITKVTGISPAAAAAGATVTIKGQGLGSTSSVDFTGDAGVPTSSVSATAVKVVVPSDARLGELTVNTTTGHHVDTTSFAPLPRIAPIASPGQAGQTVAITGTNLMPDGNPPTAKLGTVPVPVSTPTQTSLVLGPLPDASVTGTLTVTTATGKASAKLQVVPTLTAGPSPAEGAAGTEVQLQGLTFSGTKSVTFANGVKAAFKLTGALGSTQTLTFSVPTTAATGPITVTNAGGGTASTGFTVDPAITGFTPASAAAGQTVTVKGSGFGLGADTRTVTVGNVAATGITWLSPTGFTFVVPDGAPVTGVVHVQVNGGTTADSAASLTVTATIASFTSGVAGDSVTITGAGFVGVTAVKFAGVDAASFTVDSATQITAVVPSGSIDGKITVVRSAGPTLTAGTSFSAAPEIDSFTPSSAGSSTQVVITGARLTGATSVEVKGTGVPWSFTVDSSTQITATVPGNAGQGHLVVTTPNGTAESATDFTYLPPPSVDGFTPGTGTAGDTVVITGSHFTGATDVSFNGTSAVSFSVDSDTQITVTIPAGATTGKISVTTPDGTGQSASDFTVT